MHSTIPFCIQIYLGWACCICRGWVKELSVSFWGTCRWWWWWRRPLFKILTHGRRLCTITIWNLCLPIYSKWAVSHSADDFLLFWPAIWLSQITKVRYKLTNGEWHICAIQYQHWQKEQLQVESFTSRIASSEPFIALILDDLFHWMPLFCSWSLARSNSNDQDMEGFFFLVW